MKMIRLQYDIVSLTDNVSGIRQIIKLTNE